MAPDTHRPRPDRAVLALWAAFGLGSGPALAAFAQAGALADIPGAVAVAVVLLNVGNVLGRLAVGPLSGRGLRVRLPSSPPL